MRITFPENKKAFQQRAIFRTTKFINIFEKKKYSIFCDFRIFFIIFIFSKLQKTTVKQIINCNKIVISLILKMLTNRN